MTMLTGTAAPRGAPLVMVVLLLSAWSGARALLWENPFAKIEAALGSPLASLSQAELTTTRLAAVPERALPPQAAALALPVAALSWSSAPEFAARLDPQLAAAHHLLWYAALREPAARNRGAGGFDMTGLIIGAGTGTGTGLTPFLPAPAPASSTTASGRWSLDAWTFWRQGSNGASVSQGRVPIYGASQAGGVLQFRLAPDARRDPRLYVRAYQALVRRGESEVALGASARPFGRVPVRVAGEVRYTDGAFSNTVRPAGYAVTELAPMRLPLGVQVEAYGQAGWVGGAGATPFAEGQVSATRELRALSGMTDNRLRLSLGAAAWGGAQEDAQRIDIGPTMRLDLNVGSVPARVSVDWRERVGGDASPGSGLAATLSTSF
jgi:hypothetical protein